MYCDYLISGKYEIRRIVNLASFCETAKEAFTSFGKIDGSIDTFICLPGVLRDAASTTAASMYISSCPPVDVETYRALWESANATYTSAAADTLVGSVNASNISAIANTLVEPLSAASVSAAAEPLASLVTPGLMVGGAALVGVTAVLAYIYRDQIRSGLSSAYNSATACFDTAKAVVEQALPVNALNKQLESRITELDEISKSLGKYALGGVEKDKLAEVVHATRTILEEIKSKGAVDAKALQARAEEVKVSLSKISFEGKGTQELGKQDVSHIKNVMICVARVLRNIFSFIGQFIASGEYNPVAKALLNRSFFISTPTTAQEDRDIRQAKESLLDTMLSASAL